MRRGAVRLALERPRAVSSPLNTRTRDNSHVHGIPAEGRVSIAVGERKHPVPGSTIESRRNVICQVAIVFRFPGAAARMTPIPKAPLFART